jgi:Protein of unknown function (DUF3500)
MSENARSFCPECESLEGALDRRDFLRAVGTTAAGAAVLTTAGASPLLAADKKTDITKPAKRPEKPAEALIKELFAGLSAEQKKAVVLPWDDKHRQGMYNAAIGARISKAYSKPQQELLERILQAISSGEEGYRQFTRNGTFDTSGAMANCGAYIFGDPSQGKYAWVFMGHHLTVRCDGDSEPGAAFGGPIYYGHSPNGYSARNCFNYQTRAVVSVYDALSEKQRKVAVVKTGSPGEHEPSVRLRPKAKKPGISYGELSKDQQALVEKVMRTILSPYRKEDADEVMQVIKATGGMEKIHLAFYPDRAMRDEQPWHFWRLEGPGFVWNFRVLPHVHTYVNCCRIS